MFLGSRLAQNPIWEKIAYIVEFDMIQTSLATDLAAATIDQKFLISATSLKCRSTRDIYIKMSKVDRICQVINKQFGLKIRI